MTTKADIVLFVSIMAIFLCLISCRSEKNVENEVLIDVAKNKPYKSIPISEFEASHGKTITLQGLAVNDKPYSYLYSGYHIHIHTDDVFFWPDYLEGEKVEVTGKAIVVKDSELEYAQIKDYRTRYFFIVDSWTTID